MAISKKISDYFSDLARKSHKKHPRTKDYFRQIQIKSVIARKRNRRLSTKRSSVPYADGLK